MLQDHLGGRAPFGCPIAGELASFWVAPRGGGLLRRPPVVIGSTATNQVASVCVCVFVCVFVCVCVCEATCGLMDKASALCAERRRLEPHRVKHTLQAREHPVRLAGND